MKLSQQPVTKVIPVDTGRELKLNVHKTFRRRQGRLFKALCMFSFRPVSTGLGKVAILTKIIFVWWDHNIKYGREANFCKYFLKTSIIFCQWLLKRVFQKINFYLETNYRNKNVGWIMLHVCENIPTKLLGLDFPFVETFILLRLIFKKRNDLDEVAFLSDKNKSRWSIILVEKDKIIYRIINSGINFDCI